MREKSYLKVDSCVCVGYDKYDLVVITPCTFEETRRAYIQAKGDGIIVGENHLQLNDNGHFKNIIMNISRTTISSESADEMYQIKKNSGGNHKRKKNISSNSSIDMIAVPA